MPMFAPAKSPQSEARNGLRPKNLMAALGHRHDEHDSMALGKWGIPEKRVVAKFMGANYNGVTGGGRGADVRRPLTTCNDTLTTRLIATRY